MKRFLSIIGSIALCAGPLMAQEYDDIYNTGRSTTRNTSTVVTNTGTRPATVVRVNTANTNVQVQGGERIINERDVDEYNRRGNYQVDDSLSSQVTSLESQEQQQEFKYTDRIVKYHNSKVIIDSRDADLVEIYYDRAPTINVIVETPYVYDPWWYDPWYRPWGWNWGWSWGWGYRPWGWHYPYYDPWFHPWGPGWGPGWGGGGWWAYGGGGCWGGGGWWIGGGG